MPLLRRRQDSVRACAPPVCSPGAPTVTLSNCPLCSCFIPGAIGGPGDKAGGRHRSQDVYGTRARGRRQAGGGRGRHSEGPGGSAGSKVREGLLERLERECPERPSIKPEEEHMQRPARLQPVCGLEGNKGLMQLGISKLVGVGVST